MAFVPGYQHDVFISYANIDDEMSIPGDSATRWVSTLRQMLQTRLDQKLGRRDAVKIWMDRGGLEGNEPVTPRIREAISSTATLVVVFSRGYLRSSWCLQERESFVQAVGGAEAAASRVFLVHLEEIPRTEWPQTFADDIGYWFYHKDPVEGLVTRLADPKPDAEEKAYWTMLNKLRTEMARKLEQLAQASFTPAVVPPEPPRNGRKTVFLAETTQALMVDRDAVAAFLLDQGYDICPTRFYSRDPAAFARAMDSDLARAALFVQLLGEDCSIRTEELPQGYEGLQLERARALGRPILRWRRKDLAVENVRDAQHRQFLQDVDVMAMDLEECKTEIVRELRRHEVKEELAQPNGVTFVLINASPQDLRVADAIGNDLQQWQIDFEILPDNLALDEALASAEYSAIMVVYGGCPQDWVQQRVRVLRQLALGKKTNAPLCAVYVAPPPLAQKEPLRCRFSSLRVIDHATLGPFLQALGAP